MANPTWLDLKNMVAAQLGKTDGAVYNTKRETLLNAARRKFYTERPWSFLKATASVTMTAKVGNLPADFNRLLNPISVYTYTGTTKYVYEKVDYSDVDSYATDTYVYAIDSNAGTIKTNQTTSPLSVEYTSLPTDHPADNTEDSTTEEAPDITPIVYLGIAMWWKSSERNEDEFKVFMDLYHEELQKMTRMDSMTKPVTFFRPRRQYLNRGYYGLNGQ
jgi:hypothetical protein